MAHLSPHHRAFTLLEMLIAVAIVLIISAVVIPTNNDDASLRLQAASSILRSDIEYAQSMTIAYPADPLVLRHADDGTKYWIALQSAPDTPIVRADTGDSYEIVFGTGRASSASGVVISSSGTTANSITFTGTGGLTSMVGQPPVFTLKIDLEWIKIPVNPTTGSLD